MFLRKIVITGGPCAGKTTAMSWIQNALIRRGYRVIFIPETATELISGGVAPWTCSSNLEYQKCQVELQLQKERIFEQGVRTMPVDKVLLICDRGVMDNRAYMNDEEWAAVLSSLHTNEIDLRDGYDAVFHLVTAAKGAVEAYTLSNNAARIETIEQASHIDDKLIAAWTGHPHFRIIDNSGDFSGKLRNLVAEILSFLGEPDPYKTERKFLIRYPDLGRLEQLPNCTKVEIFQTYLISRDDTQIRIRQRGTNGHYIFTRSEKRQLTPLRRVDVERRLTQEEYMSQLMEADPTAHPIKKTRYCLVDHDQYYEIDVYPEWKKQAILEIEVPEDQKEIRFPEDITIIREVSGDKRYKNYALAHEMISEDKEE